MQCRGSIIIPAHNEEHRIRGLLRTLVEASLHEHYAIFVVCNGCTDRTREVAQEFEGIRVVEIDDLGKHFALNEGDRLAGDIFPRLYCDADIQTDPSSLALLVEELTTDAVVAAGPNVRYGVDDCSWGIKQYYRALGTPIMAKWLDLHLMGRGLYGASRQARARFETFPPLFADDKFFDAQYGASEKVVVPGAVVAIWTPSTLRELLRNETRVAMGNRQLLAFLKDEPRVGVAPDETAHSSPSQKLATLKQWAGDISFADSLPVATYLSVTTMTRVCLALLKLRQRRVRWR